MNLKKAFNKNNLHPKVGIEINDIPTLLELVKSGKWYTILTQATIKNEKGISCIPIAGKNMTRTAMIISIKEVYEKKAVKVFLAILKSLV